MLLGILWWQTTCVMQVHIKRFILDILLTALLGTMADTLLRLFLISAAIVDADTVATSHPTQMPQLLPVSSF